MNARKRVRCVAVLEVRSELKVDPEAGQILGSRVFRLEIVVVRQFFSIFAKA